MKITSLHSPLVRRSIEAVNEERLDDFMALFAHNATVVDVSTYHGLDEIRAWAQRENFGVHMHIEVQEQDAEGTTLEISARSQGGYSGPGTFSFTIREGLIERLVIG